MTNRIHQPTRSADERATTNETLGAVLDLNTTKAEDIERRKILNRYPILQIVKQQIDKLPASIPLGFCLVKITRDCPQKDKLGVYTLALARIATRTAIVTARLCNLYLTNLDRDKNAKTIKKHYLRYDAQLTKKSGFIELAKYKWHKKPRFGK